MIDIDAAINSFLKLRKFNSKIHLGSISSSSIRKHDVRSFLAHLIENDLAIKSF